MKKKSVYTILIILCIIGFWLFENFYTPGFPHESDENIEAEIIDSLFLPNSKSGMVVRHTYYMLSYSEPHEQAEWVAHKLKRDHLTNDDRQRPYFIEDPKVPTKSADWKNYRGSGYDRGHLCPAGDRRFSEHAYNETFYTSNITPQLKDFNAGIWNRLEQQVRKWCRFYNAIYVITGGVLEDGLLEIGDEDVDVPRYFYKIVFRKDDGEIKVLAFLIPHRESHAPLKEFLVTVDELEQVTGLDFFEKMERLEQETMESTISLKGWKF